MIIIQSNLQYAEQKFDNVNTESSITSDSEFTNCTFRNCNFSAKTFSECLFEKCLFDNCNLNTLKVPNSKFISCSFKYSKATGINWSVVRKELGIELNFDNCDLSYSVFDQLNLSFSQFTNCKITEANFVQTILRNTRFDNSELDQSIFNKTDFSDADLRTAHNYIFDPRENKCKNTRISSNEGINLLSTLGLIID